MSFSSPALPLTTFLLVSTVYVKTLNLSVSLLISECYKLFVTTNWTSVRDGSSFLDIVQTRFTEDMSATLTQTEISTGKVTYITNVTIVWSVNKIVIVSTVIVERGYRHRGKGELYKMESH